MYATVTAALTEHRSHIRVCLPRTTAALNNADHTQIPSRFHAAVHADKNPSDGAVLDVRKDRQMR